MLRVEVGCRCAALGWWGSGCLRLVLLEEHNRSWGIRRRWGDGRYGCRSRTSSLCRLWDEWAWICRSCSLWSALSPRNLCFRCLRLPWRLTRFSQRWWKCMVVCGRSWSLLDVKYPQFCHIFLESSYEGLQYRPFFYRNQRQKWHFLLCFLDLTQSYSSWKFSQLLVSVSFDFRKLLRNCRGRSLFWKYYRTGSIENLYQWCHSKSWSPFSILAQFLWPICKSLYSPWVSNLTLAYWRAGSVDLETLSDSRMVGLSHALPFHRPSIYIGVINYQPRHQAKKRTDFPYPRSGTEPAAIAK